MDSVHGGLRWIQCICAKACTEAGEVGVEWSKLRQTLLDKDIPPKWREWIAMLVMKPGEQVDNLERRRDLWLVQGSRFNVNTQILE